MKLKSRKGGVYFGSYAFVAIIVIVGVFLILLYATINPEFKESTTDIISSITGTETSSETETLTEYDSPEEAYLQEVLFYTQTLGLIEESTRQREPSLSGEDFIEHFDVPKMKCTYKDLRIFVMTDMIKHADCGHEFKIYTDSDDLVIIYYEWGEVGELLCSGGNLYYWIANN